MTPAVSIKNLHKQYDNGVSALSGINLDIQQGDFFALLGPNGAGKSTTIGIITTLVKKTQGSVQIMGLDIDKQPAQAKNLLGVVPQEFNMNVFEHGMNILLYQAGFYGIPAKLAKSRAEDALKRLGLWEKRFAPSRSLSGGMKRRLMIARALVHRPKVLILDEPTAGVDTEVRHMMWDFMKEINAGGTTVILTTHYLEEAEHLCRTVAIINNGQIIEHKPTRELLDKLDQETFILYLKKPIESAPNLGDSATELLDPSTLSIRLHKNTPISNVFNILAQQNIEILSLRNKSSRLEELFLQLTRGATT